MASSKSHLPSAMSERLLFEVDRCRDQLIGRGDHSGIGLKRLLRPDQLDKLAGEINIGAFQSPRLNGPGTAGPRASDNRLSGENRLTEQVLAYRLETNCTGEFGQRHALQIQLLTIREQTFHLPLLIDAEILQNPRTITILGLQQGRRGGGELRCALETARSARIWHEGT